VLRRHRALSADVARTAVRSVLGWLLFPAPTDH
jgi:hypothetical protein